MSTSHISETKADASYWYRQFQLQQNTKDGLQAQLRKVEADLEEHRRVIAEAMALHHVLKYSESVSCCIMCAERWPCESVAILSGDGSVAADNPRIIVLTEKSLDLAVDDVITNAMWDVRDAVGFGAGKLRDAILAKQKEPRPSRTPP